MKAKRLAIVFFQCVLTVMLALQVGCSGDTTTNGLSKTDKITAKLIGGEINITTASDDQQNPQVVYLEDKNVYFVVWEDYRDRNQTTTDFEADPTKFAGADIWAKFISADGTTPCGLEFAITNKLAGNQTLPQVAYRPGDKLVVTWQDSQGTTASGYVRYAAVTGIPSNTACGNPPAPAIGDIQAVNFTSVLDNEAAANVSRSQTAVSFANFSSVSGASPKFNTSFTPIVPGTLQIKQNPSTDTDPNLAVDLGNGSLTGTLGGTVNYTTGAVTVTNNTLGKHDVRLDVYYESYNPAAGANQTLKNRQNPKIKYDKARDEFWLGWVESRDTNKIFSVRCWGVPFTWLAGDTSLAGYMRLDGSNLAIKQNDLGNTEADILRNSYTTSGRLISSSASATTMTFVYEYFNSLNNLVLSSDDTSPETFFVWEGNRQEGTLTCTLDEAKGIVTSAFAAKDKDGGKTHIYGIFDKEIILGSLWSKWVDFSNTANGSNPSLAVDTSSVPRKFLVAWEDNRGGDNTKIYGQLVNSGGDLYNVNKLISFSDFNGSGTQEPIVANSRQTRPYVSFDSTENKYFVSWQDGRNGLSSENLDVYGQYVNLDGTLRGGNYPITTSPSSQLAPSLAYNTLLKQFLAVWKDARSVTDGGTGTADVRGQLFSAGQPIMSLLNLNNTPFTPALLDFGTVTAGTTLYKSFKVRNIGDVDLNITSVTSPTDTAFTVTPQTVAKLPVGAEQTFTVAYLPVAGSTNATFTINSDGNNATVSLSGIGVQPQLSVSSTNVVFGSAEVGQSLSQNVTLTNSGTTDITLTSISGLSPSSPFSITNMPSSFPQSLAAGNSLTLAVLFLPTDSGSFSGSINVQTTLSSLSQIIALSGTGTKAQLTTSATSVDYGTVNTGTSKDLTFTLGNTGNRTLTVNSMTVGGNSAFSVVSPSGSFSIAEGTTQQVTVRFQPSTLSAYNGSLSVVSDGGTQTITLTGQGAAGVLSLSPTQVDYGTTAINNEVTKSIVVTNTGNAPLTISGHTTPANSAFTVSIVGNYPVQLLPDTSFTYKVSFSSSNAGLSQSSFTINSNASNGNQTVNLQAITSALAIQTTTLPSGTLASAYSQTLQARGGTQPYTWSLVTPNGGALPAGLSLAPNTGIISGTPTAPGNYVFIVNVTDVTGLTASQTMSIDVSGGGSTSSTALFTDNSGVTLPNAPYSFSNIFKGLSVTRSLRLLNNGTTPITITGAAVYKVSTSGSATTTPELAYVTSLPTSATIQPDNFLPFDMVFTPQSAGTYPAMLVVSTASGTTYSLPVTGNGTAVSVNVNTTTQPTAVISSYGVISSQQYSSTNKPAGFTTVKAVDIVITGVTTGGVATLTVTFDALPANPVFYKVVGNTWTPFTPDSINGTTIQFNVTDNAATMDSDMRDGIIHDPVIVGTMGVVNNDPGSSTPPSSGGKSGCFIATAAYGSYLDPNVVVLRNFRDNILLKNTIGTAFVKFYYTISPTIADFIREHETLRVLTRLLLTPLIYAVKYAATFASILVISALFYIRMRTRIRI